jgi:hypothetical protein
MGAELFHMDGQMDRVTKLIVAFRNFVRTPKNGTQTSAKCPPSRTLSPIY